MKAPQNKATYPVDTSRRNKTERTGRVCLGPTHLVATAVGARGTNQAVIVAVWSLTDDYNEAHSVGFFPEQTVSALSSPDSTLMSKYTSFRAASQATQCHFNTNWVTKET